jgi:hypothetical protein
MLKVLTFLNLLDSTNKLSITNGAMYIILIKICLSPFDWQAAVSLFVVLLNYMNKRKTISDVNKTQLDVDTKIQEAISKTNEQLNDLQSKVNAAMLRVGIK